MNFAAFERAQVAAFAYREARHTGSLDCLRAVCFILRNRVKSAWGDGGWLTMMEGCNRVAAHEEQPAPENAPIRSPIDSRLLQMIVRDVDDIYLGQDNFDDHVRQVVCGDAGMKLGNSDWKPVLYYSFVDRASSLRPWFVENIIRKPLEHAQVGQIGTMMLYR